MKPPMSLIGIVAILLSCSSHDINTNKVVKINIHDKSEKNYQKFQLNL
jgi:hypothetical protein